jgi:hypothetical protein
MPEKPAAKKKTARKKAAAKKPTTVEVEDLPSAVDARAFAELPEAEAAPLTGTTTAQQAEPAGDVVARDVVVASAPVEDAAPQLFRLTLTAGVFLYQLCATYLGRRAARAATVREVCGALESGRQVTIQRAGAGFTLAFHDALYVPADVNKDEEGVINVNRRAWDSRMLRAV